MKDFERRDIRIIAASADNWEKAIQTAEAYKLAFTIGFGLDAARVSALTGAFYSAREKHLHATGFILGPDGRIEDAVYGSRSIGRLVAKDCLEFIGP